jgi:hypothetical protein
MLFITTLTNAQEYKLEGKTITGTFDIKDKGKSEMFALINKWISINYNSAKNVVQMNDLESGTIIIKGINEVKYKNPLKIIYPNLAAEFTTIKFNHLIEVNVKDNKFRIIYKLIEIYMVDATVINDTKMICVNLDGSRKAEVDEYMVLTEENFKKAYKNKEKREKLLEASRLSFEEVNTNLINDIKATMQSVEKSVIEETKDKW